MRHMLCLGYIMLVFSGKDTFIQAHSVRLKDNKFETRLALMGYCYNRSCIGGEHQELTRLARGFSLFRLEFILGNVAIRSPARLVIKKRFTARLWLFQYSVQSLHKMVETSTVKSRYSEDEGEIRWFTL